MRTRNLSWVDIDSGRPWFGFQVCCDGKWFNAAENGQACVYPTAEERDAKRAQFRKMKDRPFRTAKGAGHG